MDKKIKDCCKTSRLFILMVSIVILTSILITLSWNGYSDQVEKIITFISYILALSGIGFLAFITFYSYGKFCGIFGIEKYEEDDYGEGRIWIGMGCLFLPIALVIILNYTAQNFDYTIRGLTFG